MDEITQASMQHDWYWKNYWFGWYAEQPFEPTSNSRTFFESNGKICVDLEQCLRTPRTVHQNHPKHIESEIAANEIWIFSFLEKMLLLGMLTMILLIIKDTGIFETIAKLHFLKDDKTTAMLELIRNFMKKIQTHLEAQSELPPTKQTNDLCLLGIYFACIDYLCQVIQERELHINEASAVFTLMERIRLEILRYKVEQSKKTGLKLRKKALRSEFWAMIKERFPRILLDISTIKANNDDFNRNASCAIGSGENANLKTTSISTVAGLDNGPDGNTDLEINLNKDMGFAKDRNRNHPNTDVDTNVTEDTGFIVGRNAKFHLEANSTNDTCFDIDRVMITNVQSNLTEDTELSNESEVSTAFETNLTAKHTFNLGADKNNDLESNLTEGTFCNNG